MDEKTLDLYIKSDLEDRELIKKLLSLYPLSYEELIIYIEKLKKHAKEIQGDLLALCDDYEKEFIEKIMYQIPEITDELFLNLLVGVKTIDNEVLSIEDYIQTNYNQIINKWHEKNPEFDMPNGVISLSVNGEEKYTKVGNNPHIDENSLYDIASMTKLYTEVILFRIIKEGKYGINLNTKLKDIKLASGDSVRKLYPKLNLNMTIGELISFNNSYITDTDIRNLDNRIDALKALRTVHTDKVKEGNYLYTDLPIMILTDLLEESTGKNYRELLTEYIIKPLGLHNTYMDLDERNQQRYTGLNKNGVNDPKSNIIGGGGHAGVITDANDLLKFLSNIFEPGFIFDSNMDPMLFDMLGMTKTTNGKYAINGEKLDKIIAKLQRLGVSEETIDKTMSEIQKQRETGVSVIGNLNVVGEGFQNNDYTYDSLAPQPLPYKAFMIQGSTRVQGDVADFVIDGEMYRTASSILIDIHNQYDNIKAKDPKSVKEYHVKSKGMMKMADARKSGLGYFGGFYDQISNMLSIARIMEIYTQYKKLNKKKTR